MQIKSLVLKDFKKHASLEVRFEPGANLIIGPNYSGKSTILRAIFIALFGNSVDATKSAKLIRRGAQDFKIELQFGHLKVVRTLKESSIERIGEEPYARGHTAVNKAVLDELGLDKDAFMKVFASEQGTPQALLSMEGTQLQRFIESIIGIGEMDDVAKRGRKLLQAAKAKCEVLHELVMQDDELHNLTADLDQTTQQLQVLRQSAEELKVKQEGLPARRTELMHELAEARAFNDRYAKWSSVNELLIAEGPLQTLIDTAELTREVEQGKEQLQELLKLAKAEEKRLTAIESLQKNYDRLQAKTPALVEVAKLSLGTLNDSSDLDQVLQVANEDIRDKRIEIKGLETMLHNAFCPTCKRTYEADFDTDSIKVKVDALYKELELLYTKQADITNRVSDAKTENTRIQKENDKILSAQKELDLINRDLSELQRDINELTTQENQYATDPAILARRQQSHVQELATHLQELQIRNDRVTTHNNRISKLESQVDSLYDVQFKQGKKDYQALDDALTLVNRNLDACMLELASVNRDITEMMFNESQLQSKLAAHQQAIDNFDREALVANRAERVLSVLAESRGKLIEEAYTKVFTVAGEFARTCTDGDIQDVKMTEDGIAYVEDGKEFDKTEASGAQRSIIGLGMKLGMAQLLVGKFDSLLLDEVSADMSEEISMRCMLALSAYCGQSISVTHRHEDVGGNVIDLIPL
jgi:DNA repair exonuclease SbcCD ATPase subunit